MDIENQSPQNKIYYGNNNYADTSTPNPIGTVSILDWAVLCGGAILASVP